MKLSDLDYDLPSSLIAQRPLDRPDASRLLVLPAEQGPCQHRTFADFPTLLEPGDLLVVNDTRVLPAKLHLRRPSGGVLEGLFVRQLADGSWEVLLQHTRRLRAGERLRTRDPRRELVLIEHFGGGRWSARVDPSSGAAGDLAAIGRTPLPHYIHRAADDDASEELDRLRYQTVFARRDGAVAAPTAGLHFTPTVLERLAERGVRLARVTLHVGVGTFAPIRAANLAEHKMHAEWYDLPSDTAAAVEQAHAADRRVVAVGTTSLRVLETCADDAGRLNPGSGWTDLFIYPPYRFRIADVLLTNFHLPGSTLLALTYAFGGMERVRDAYSQAVAAAYRFYSFGDAMLVFRHGARDALQTRWV